MYGALVGILLLGLLDAATSSQAAEGRAGGIIGAVSKTIQRIVDPTVPAIPDRSDGSSTSGASDTTAATVEQVSAKTSSSSGPSFSFIGLTTTKAKSPKPIPSQPTISALEGPPMLRKGITYLFVTAGIYILVAGGTNSGKLLIDGANGAAEDVGAIYGTGTGGQAKAA
jgi:hypothetical protein